MSIFFRTRATTSVSQAWSLKLFRATRPWMHFRYSHSIGNERFLFLVPQNRFSGEKYELNNVELSMYDFVMGATMCMEMELPCNVTELRQGLSWFKKNNSEAYMVLLD